MKQKTTKAKKEIPVLLTVILDESGSMGVKRQDVIGGFNQFLTDQQANKAPCRMMITKFNTVCTQTEWGDGKPVAPLAEIPKLTEGTYVPGGNTALYDAIAQTVKRAETEKKPKERVLCLIMTDGEENSSRETTFDQVKQLIQAKEKEQWTFLYIGEQPERWAEMMGVPVGTTVAYDTLNPGSGFQTACFAATSYRHDPNQDTSDMFTRDKD